MSRKARGLSAADIAIWRAVAATIPQRMPDVVLPGVSGPALLPLGPSPRVLLPGTAAVSAPQPAPPPRPTAPGWSPPPQRVPTGPGSVDRALRKRLAAGRQSVDAALDLHGLRQGEAHARLQTFLAQAQRDGRRVVLVVTGKGRGGADRPHGETGVLRRLVPLWLAEARLAPLVVGFGEAGRDHGGDGALYIHLRARSRREPA